MKKLAKKRIITLSAGASMLFGALTAPIAVAQEGADPQPEETTPAETTEETTQEGEKPENTPEGEEAPEKDAPKEEGEEKKDTDGGNPDSNEPGKNGEGFGVWIPNQGYQGSEQGSTKEWVGTYYDKDGRLSWCVSFGLTEPKVAQEKGATYKDGGKLKRKDGSDLPAEDAALLSYAADRGQKEINNPDASKEDKDAWAAAVANLMHAKTASHMETGPNVPYDKVGYDEGWHDEKLPDKVKEYRQQIIDGAAEHPGPWALNVDTESDAIVGQPTKFTVTLKAKNDAPIDQDVKIKAEGLDGAPETITLKDGTAEFEATPTDKNAHIEASTDGVPGELTMEIPSDGKSQNIVIMQPRTVVGTEAALESADFGKVTIKKVAAGKEDTPVEGAQIAIYTADQIKEAGLETSSEGKPDTKDSDNAEDEDKNSDNEKETSTNTNEEDNKDNSDNNDSEGDDSTTTVETNTPEEPRQGEVETTTDESETETTEEDTTTDNEGDIKEETGNPPTEGEDSTDNEDHREVTPADGSGPVQAGYGATASVLDEDVKKHSETLEKLNNLEPVTILDTTTDVIEGELTAGDYYAVELAAPSGLIPDPTPLKFSVSPGGTADVTLVDELLQHQFVKKDAVSGEQLAGAEYELKKCDTDEVADTITTGKDGTVMFSVPEAGCWEAIEKKAPEGYELDESPIRFEVENKPLQVVGEDQKKEQKPVPRKIEKRVEVKSIPTGGYAGARK